MVFGYNLLVFGRSRDVVGYEHSILQNGHVGFVRTETDLLGGRLKFHNSL